MRPLTLLALALPLLAAPAVARAQTEPATPQLFGLPLVFGGSFDTKLQSEVTSVDHGKTRVSLFNDSDLNLFAHYGQFLSLNTDIKLERTRNSNLNSYYPDRNAAFRSEAITLRQAYLTLRPAEGVEVYGGKIHPAFGRAWEELPGTFANFASDYEQDERIGFGLRVRLPDVPALQRGALAQLGLSNIRASIETFYLDTSDLSASLPRGPSLFDSGADRAWRYVRGAYGPSNTGGLDSWTAALAGGRKGGGLAWQASLTSEATRAPGGKTEFGQSFSALYDPAGSGIPLTRHLGLTPFVEYTHFTNFAGVPGLERHYATAGATLGWASWELAAAAGLRRSSEPGQPSTSDHQENLTLTYEIAEGLKAGAGINHISLNGRGSWTLAPALSYSRSF
jgi:hypothetical protein